jgi:hypothetical protein
VGTTVNDRTAEGTEPENALLNERGRTRDVISEFLRMKMRSRLEEPDFQAGYLEGFEGAIALTDFLTSLGSNGNATSPEDILKQLRAELTGLEDDAQEDAEG